MEEHRGSVEPPSVTGHLDDGELIVKPTFKVGFCVLPKKEVVVAENKGE